MGQWSKSDFKKSISGLLGRLGGPPSDSVLENGLEDIREAMLSVLGDTGSKQFPQAARKIRYATDIEDLWYLRGELMGVVAQMHGEHTARKTIAKINARFRGLLPGGLNSRPSPLGG